MLKVIRRQSPGRIIALGFAAVILLGSLLLSLPCSVQDGVELDDRQLAVRSEAFAVRSGGRSARVAKQFIELCKAGVFN